MSGLRPGHRIAKSGKYRAFVTTNPYGPWNVWMVECGHLCGFPGYLGTACCHCKGNSLKDKCPECEYRSRHGGAK